MADPRTTAMRDWCSRLDRLCDDLLEFSERVVQSDSPVASEVGKTVSKSLHKTVRLLRRAAAQARAPQGLFAKLVRVDEETAALFGQQVAPQEVAPEDLDLSEMGGTRRLTGELSLLSQRLLVASRDLFVAKEAWESNTEGDVKAQAVLVREIGEFHLVEAIIAMHPATHALAQACLLETFLNEGLMKGEIPSLDPVLPPV